MSPVLKLSSPATGEFWKIPILFEDARLLALDKPAGLAVSPDRAASDRPALMPLLHRDLARRAPWAAERNLAYLANTHRLDTEASGVLLLAKDKAALVDLASQFGSEKPGRIFAALVRGQCERTNFDCDAKLGPNLLRPGFTRVDPKEGKRSRTEFIVREKFDGYLLLECRPLTYRPHQIRVHLKHLRLPLVGDTLYGGPALWLSTLKPDYRLKPGKTERALLARPALHAEKLTFSPPAGANPGAEPLSIEAPWAKDLTVALKYLRMYVGASGGRSAATP